MACSNGRVAVLIVGFRNAGDVRECVSALGRCSPQNFDVFLCENGGAAAFQEVCDELSGRGIVQKHCEGLACSVSARVKGLVRASCYRLSNTEISLVIGEAAENIGYAGGVNIWLRPLLEQHGYAGFWILNPDTIPEPDALRQLVDHAKLRKKGMVGSRIVPAGDLTVVHSRGLRWSPVLVRTKAVDFHAPANFEPDMDRVERLIDAPSGSSFYVTRECVEQIGLMDERYFLYYEDLDWGVRAKRRCGVGYAWRSIVPHHGGTTIGTAARRAARSRLSVYLEFRNRILFVRNTYPGWLPWTIAILLIRALEYGCVGSITNAKAAYSGISAGVAGEEGRPDQMMAVHLG